MKKLSILFLSAALVFISFNSQATQDSCSAAIKAGGQAAAKDKQCQKEATNLVGNYMKQVNTCRTHRKNLRDCRRAKRAARKDCRQLKGDQRKQCNKDANEARKACRDEAKQEAAFQICKDARKLTGKSAGNAIKCAAKHFSKAAQICAVELGKAIAN
jgi:hypothetical protein